MNGLSNQKLFEICFMKDDDIEKREEAKILKQLEKIIGQYDVVIVSDFGILEIPAHTRSHIAFYNDKTLFSGDTLFSVGCGRFFEGTRRCLVQRSRRLLHLHERTLYGDALEPNARKELLVYLHQE